MIDFSTETAIALLNSGNDYPVDLDEAWQWLGYATKQKAEKKLKQNFEEGIDYTLIQMVKRVEGNNGGGSTRYNQIMLTVDCFKSLGMTAGTEQGKQIRKYFLECEKIAKQKPDALTELQILARTVARMAEQEQRVLEQEHRASEQQKLLEQAETRLTAIEAEQGRYFSPSGSKYTVLGFAKKQGLEISLATSSEKGRKAASMCRKRGIDIERINDPRFGSVGLYPESVLIEVFR